MSEYSELYAGQEVPDPYHGSDEGFNHVIDMLEESCAGLISHLSK
jgi:protein-tyrosine phosphatase